MTDLRNRAMPAIIVSLTGLIPVHATGSARATLAQSAEQTLRKRQVKGSNPLGGLADAGRPQPLSGGAFAIPRIDGMANG